MKHELDGYLGKIARTFSAHWGVQVIVGGAGGLRTDVKNMVIYVPETASCLVDSDRAAFEGALDHEVGHVRAEVDFPKGERPSDLMASLGKIEAHLFNLCEDVRIELAAGNRWHGCKINLDALRTWASVGNREAFTSKTSPPMFHLVGVGYFAAAMGSSHEVAWLPADVQALVASLDPFVQANIKAKTPRETRAVALGLADFLRKLEEPPPPEPDAGDGHDEQDEQSGQPGQDNDCDGQPGQDNDCDGQDEQPGQPGQDDRDDEDNDCDGQDGQDDDCDGQDDRDDRDDRDDEGELPRVEAEANAAEQPEPGQHGEQEQAAAKAFRVSLDSADDPETPAHLAVEDLVEKSMTETLKSRHRHLVLPAAKALDKSTVPETCPGPYFSRLQAEAAPLVGGIATRLVNLLRAPSPTRLSDRESGQIDSRALSSARAGCRTVFSEVVKRPGRNATVMILLDASGSMDYKIETARQTAYVMGEVLNRLGISFEMRSWYEDSSPHYTVDEAEIYTRLEPRLYNVYKTFDENWPRVSSRLMAYHAMLNNDDGGAVRECAVALAKRPEPMKILLVLSDGEPCHAGSRGSVRQEMANNHLHDAIGDATKAGIKVGGFGICTDHVGLFYPHSAAVKKLEDMPKAAVGLLAKLLRQ